VFEIKQTKGVDITICGLSGKYKITKYRLDRDHGSAFDEWVKMGAPQNINLEELYYLKSRTSPEMLVDFKEISGGYKYSSNVPVHGSELILLESKI
jgi:xylan 1,4-beta-xylosidase